MTVYVDGEPVPMTAYLQVVLEEMPRQIARILWPL